MERNKSIEGFRGLLIIFIVLYHYTYRFPQIYAAHIPVEGGFLEGKTLGVIVFFVLSGFYFSQSIKYRITSSSEFTDIIHFMRQKIERLYLPFAITVTLIFVISLIFPTDRAASALDITLLGLFHHIKLIDGAHWYIFALLQLQILGTFLLYTYRRKKILLFILPLAFLVYIRFYGSCAFSISHVIAFSTGVFLNLNEDFPKKSIMLFCYGLATISLVYIQKSYLLFLLLAIFFILILHKSVL